MNDLAQLRLTEARFIALDIEATGIAYGHDRIIEIAAVCFEFGDRGQVVPGQTFDFLVDPEIPIPELVATMTGIDDGMVAGQPTLDSVWDRVVSFMEDAGERHSLVLAHSASSDLAYLASEASRLSLTLPDVPFACTLDVARRALPEAPKYTLGALVAGLGRAAATDATFHRALADALHTRNLFEHCVSHSGAKTLGELGIDAPVEVPDPSTFKVEVPARLGPLVTAIRDSQRVKIVYRGGSKGTMHRPVTPLAFFSRLGEPHLHAWCHLDDSAKTFRCDRIQKVVT